MGKKYETNIFNPQSVSPGFCFDCWQAKLQGGGRWGPILDITTNNRDFFQGVPATKPFHNMHSNVGIIVNMIFEKKKTVTTKQGYTSNLFYSKMEVVQLLLLEETQKLKM